VAAYSGFPLPHLCGSKADFGVTRQPAHSFVPQMVNDHRQRRQNRPVVQRQPNRFPFLRADSNNASWKSIHAFHCLCGLPWWPTCAPLLLPPVVPSLLSAIAIHCQVLAISEWIGGPPEHG
jgi:hypothetical protein